MGSLSNAIPGIRDVPYLIAHGVVIGTGPHLVNSVAALGAAGTVLTSNGAGADPTFQAIAAGGSLVRAPQYINASSVYQIPVGCTKLFVKVKGAGGAGGGAATAAGDAAAGSGGGGGALAQKFYTGVVAGTNITTVIGAGGIPGAAGNAPGGNGGTTTFDSTAVLGAAINAGGGNGGNGCAAGAVPFVNAPSFGGAATGPADLKKQGGNGRSGIVLSGTVAKGGAGGFSADGADGAIETTVAGAGSNGAANGITPGNGGAGGLVLNGSAAVAGGSGQGGQIEIWEFT